MKRGDIDMLQVGNRVGLRASRERLPENLQSQIDLTVTDLGISPFCQKTQFADVTGRSTPRSSNYFRSIEATTEAEFVTKSSWAMLDGIAV